MAVTSDGSQGFGLTATTFDGLVVESFSENNTSTRVDLNDSNGEPLGSTTIPGRVEFSATVQVGAGGPTLPTIGEEITYNSVAYIITDVTLNETAADYQRVSLSGYKKIN